MFNSKFLFCLLALFALQQCCLALVGDRCPSNRCTVGHCDDGVCLCGNTEVASTNKKKCLPVAQTLGSGCEEERQCTLKLGRFSTCIRNQCGCKANAAVVNKVCRKNGGLVGDRCVGSKCDVGFCDNGVCSCKSNVEVVSPGKDACLQVATTLGSGCETDAQCTKKLGQLSHCINFQCGCKSNAVAQNNTCRRK